MNKMSDAQRGKIFKLRSQLGIDDDTLHSHIYSLVGKSSIKDLSVRDAITVIDALLGKRKSSPAPGMASDAQKHIITEYAKEYGYVDEYGELREEQLNIWLHKKFKASHMRFLTSKKASDAIEGLKKMVKRKREEEAAAEVEMSCYSI